MLRSSLTNHTLRIQSKLFWKILHTTAKFQLRIWIRCVGHAQHSCCQVYGASFGKFQWNLILLYYYARLLLFPRLARSILWAGTDDVVGPAMRRIDASVSLTAGHVSVPEGDRHQRPAACHARHPRFRFLSFFRGEPYKFISPVLQNLPRTA
jgi:hypothetical protein